MSHISREWKSFKNSGKSAEIFVQLFLLLLIWIFVFIGTNNLRVVKL